MTNSAAATATLTRAINEHMTAHNYHTCFSQASLVAIWFENYGFAFDAVRFDEMVQEALESAKAERKARYYDGDDAAWDAQCEREAQELTGQELADMLDMPYEHVAESRGF